MSDKKPTISSNQHVKPAGINWELVFKWGLMIAAYAFLAYKLITFDQYSDLLSVWQKMPMAHFSWLVVILALLPLNWLLEALKWQLLTKHIQKTNLIYAIKAVLAGIASGFFTPNRVGEFVGRLLFLKTENRKAGVTLSAVNSLTQNLIMALCGLPACIIFLQHGNNIQLNVAGIIGWTIGSVLLLGLIYVLLPYIKFSSKIKDFTACLSDFSALDLVAIMFVSLLRYVVFSIQFGFMLAFFNIDLTLTQAYIAIPTTYLFVTFTPAFAFSEAAIRSSYAVLVIGAYSGQVVGIALAGLCIWMVNFVIPMLAGSAIMVRQKP